MYCIVYDEWTGTENGFDSTNGDAWNYLKLSVTPASASHDKEVPEKVSGLFRLWDIIGTFGALVRDEGETANYWYIDEVEWSKVPEDDDNPGPTDVDEKDDIKDRQRFGHGITVLKTLDDRGHPFVELIYNMGPDKTGGARMVRALGKKQKGDQDWFGLTPEEAERLMEDGVADELEGLGWEPPSDNEDEENGQDISASLVVNPSESSEDVVAGMKRKAEDQADDSERRPAGRKD
jgi:hypothetical protein